MAKIDRILAAVNPDQSASSAAVRGAELAKRFNAHLTLFSVVYESAASFDLFHLVSSDHMSRVMLDEAEAYLQGLSKTLGLSENQVSIQVHWGHPFDQCVREAAESMEADLICFSPRDQRSQKLSHAEWRLVHKSGLPVLLCKNRPWSTPAVVAAALDVSATDRDETKIDHQILDLATLLSTELGSMELFHAAHEVPDAISIAQPPEEYRAQLEEHRKSLLLGMLPEDLQPQPSIHIQFEDPNTAIPDFCSERPVDLLVMGIFARHRITNFLIGSTARALLPRLPCDVLAVPPARAG